jgi:hypothetical protein
MAMTSKEHMEMAEALLKGQLESPSLYLTEVARLHFDMAQFLHNTE